MLKVCKLDINWAAEGWGTERVGVFFSCSGDVTGFGCGPARSGEEAVAETLKDSEGRPRRPRAGGFWLCCCITCVRMGKLLHLLSSNPPPVYLVSFPSTYSWAVFTAALSFVCVVVQAPEHCDAHQTPTKETTFGELLKAAPRVPRPEHTNAAPLYERNGGAGASTGCCSFCRSIQN